MKTTILKKAKRTLSLLLVLLMVVPITVSLAVPVSAEDLKYEVEGGYIYFDPSTGTITSCDQSVTKAVIPSKINGVSVTSIGEYAFNYCTSLTSITIPDSVTSIGFRTFSCCYSLTSIIIPNGVTSIGEDAFSACTSLESITIPNTVTSIGKSAFASCNSLTSITIPDSVTSIGENAFHFCTSLTSVTIGDSVTSIGDYAFYSCESLTSVTIPDSVTSIGEWAFSYCDSLMSVTIGDSVTSIGEGAFDNCESLMSINVDVKNESYCDIDGILFTKDKTKLIRYPNGRNGSYIIPDSVTSIGREAFFGCSSLTSVTLPDSVTSIGEGAFAWCTGLTSVTIPDSVTSIGEGAFSGCYSLTSITIPDSVTSIGEGAFGSCDSLTSINVDVKNESYCDIDGILFTKDKTKLIRYPNGRNGSYVISNNVTSIGDYAFSGCHSLTSITIPDSVTSIGEGAFRGCYSLTSITIPDSVTSIGEGAFAWCTGLTSINVDVKNESYCDIDGVLFTKDKTKLISCPGGKNGSYVIPDSVTSIGGYTFCRCTSLTSVTIPDSVTSIGDYAFYSCDKLKNVYYCGSEEEWKKIYVSVYNYDIESATITYNYSCSVVGHAGDGWITDVEASCTETGIRHRICSVCGEIENEILPVTDHHWGEWIVTTESGCGTAGEETRTCADCEAFETQVVPATGNHTYGEWIVTIEPTVFEKGVQTRKCENCDATETEEIDKLEMTNPFTDVKDGQWYTEGILWCYHSGYMAGVSETEFGRKSNVTRAMFATILAKIDGSDISGYSEMSFTDVKPNQWYSNAIEWAASNGYAAGLGGGLFGYKQNVSREQIALFFYTYSEKNGIDVSEKADLSAYADLGRVHSWALDAMEWAVAKGLIGGTSETTLSPRDSATRAEIALIVKNYVENVKSRP